MSVAIQGRRSAPFKAQFLFPKRQGLPFRGQGSRRKFPRGWRARPAEFGVFRKECSRSPSSRWWAGSRGSSGLPGELAACNRRLGWGKGRAWGGHPAPGFGPKLGPSPRRGGPHKGAGMGRGRHGLLGAGRAQLPGGARACRAPRSARCPPGLTLERVQGPASSAAQSVPSGRFYSPGAGGVCPSRWPRPLRPRPRPLRPRPRPLRLRPRPARPCRESRYQHNSSRLQAADCRPQGTAGGPGTLGSHRLRCRKGPRPGLH